MGRSARRRRAAAAAIAVLTLTAAAGTSPAATPAKPAACPKAKATRIVDGARTCVAAATLRVRPVAGTTQGGIAVALLRLDPPGPRPRRPAVAARGIPPALLTPLARRYPAAQDGLVASARAELAKKPAAREAATVTQGPGTITQNADGSVSGTGSVTVTDGGRSATVDIGLKATRDGKLDVSLDVGYADGAGRRVGKGMTFRDVTAQAPPDCPTATGDIPYQSGVNGTSRSSEVITSGRATLATVREAVTVVSSVKANAALDDDATLKPVPFTATGSLDYSRSATALAFFGARTRGVARGTLTGTVDPATGAITGATLRVTATTSGFGGDAAAADKEFRDALERLMRDDAGRMLKHLREVEERARGGKCTKLTLTPGSPGDLPAGSTVNVAAKLETTSGAAVTKVRWQATPGKGGVQPTTSRDPQPAFAVRGEGPGTETARVTVKAVSAAGISEAVWVGQESPFPLTYSGTVRHTQNFTVHVEAWNGTVTYTRESQKTNPDGTRDALYRLTQAFVASHVGTGGCVHSAAPGGTILFGDLEIRVDAAGRWTSSFVVDVELGPTTVRCDPAPAVIIKPKAFLNTRTTAAALRPMEARGAIAGVDVTDVLGSSPALPITANWSLTPAG